jgi:hypothetical protein
MKFGTHINVIVAETPPRKCINIISIVVFFQVFLSEPRNWSGGGGGGGGGGGEYGCRK